MVFSHPHKRILVPNGLFFHMDVCMDLGLISKIGLTLPNVLSTLHIIDTYSMYVCRYMFLVLAATT